MTEELFSDRIPGNLGRDTQEYLPEDNIDFPHYGKGIGEAWDNKRKVSYWGSTDKIVLRVHNILTCLRLERTINEGKVLS